MAYFQSFSCTPFRTVRHKTYSDTNTLSRHGDFCVVRARKGLVKVVMEHLHERLMRVEAEKARPTEANSELYGFALRLAHISPAKASLHSLPSLSLPLKHFKPPLLIFKQPKHALRTC